jgi:myosin heavy subunit
LRQQPPLAITGPAGIAAAAIGAIAGAFGLLVNRAKEANRQYREQSEALRKNADEADALLAAYGKLNPGKTIDKNTTEALINLYPELTGKIRENMTTVEEAARIAKEHAASKAVAVEKAGPFYKNLQEKQEGMAAYIQSLDALAADERTALAGIAEAERIIAGTSSSKGQLKNAESALEVFRGQLALIRDSIKKETAEQKSLSDEIKAGYDEINKRLAQAGKGINTLGISYDVKIEPPKTSDGLAGAADQLKNTLLERLKSIQLSPQQVLGEQINQIKSYLLERAALLEADGVNRVQAIHRIRQQIIASNNLKAMSWWRLPRRPIKP